VPTCAKAGLSVLSQIQTALPAQLHGQLSMFQLSPFMQNESHHIVLAGAQVRVQLAPASAHPPVTMGADCQQGCDEVCWICLEGSSEAAGPLMTPCKCVSRPLHQKCLARWQLQSAGTECVALPSMSTVARDAAFLAPRAG
jgi:hypothetical protein